MTIYKKVLRVTIEKEIEIELTPTLLGEETEQEFLAGFSRAMWEVDSMDDIFKYAAEMAAKFGSGLEHDYLGLLSAHYSTYPRVPDVKFREITDDCDVEILYEQPS